MSWLRPALNTYLRWTEKRFLMHATPEQARRSFLMKARLFFHTPFGVTVRAGHCGPGDALYVESRDAPDGPVIFYIHGGGFVFGAPETHVAMLAALAKRAGATAVLPRYPLAPEVHFPAAFDHLAAAYAACVAEFPGRPLVVGGDSAGGALALSLLARLIRDGGTLPAAVFAFSPLTDLTFSGESFRANAGSEVVLPAVRAAEMSELYLAGHDPKDPDASPLFADFTGAPPVWITVGDTEILRDDSRRMVARLRAQGVDVTFEEEHDLPHVWPIFHNTLPEARRTLDNLAAWIADQTGASAPTR